jgi:hypothetical protein
MGFGLVFATVTECRVWNTAAILANLDLIQGDYRFAKGGNMENLRIEELRSELNQLLKKQTKVLEARAFGGATDTELLEYEIRQEIIHEICDELAHSCAA